MLFHVQIESLGVKNVHVTMQHASPEPLIKDQKSNCLTLAGVRTRKLLKLKDLISIGKKVSELIAEYFFFPSQA